MIITLYYTNHLYKNTFHSFMIEKEIQAQITEGDFNGIVLNNVKIDNITLICEYINALYPYPKLIPSSPVLKLLFRYNIDLIMEAEECLRNIQKGTRSFYLKKLRDIGEQFNTLLQDNDYTSGPVMSLSDLFLCNVMIHYQDVKCKIFAGDNRIISVIRAITSRRSFDHYHK